MSLNNRMSLNELFALDDKTGNSVDRKILYAIRVLCYTIQNLDVTVSEGVRRTCLACSEEYSKRSLTYDLFSELNNVGSGFNCWTLVDAGFSDWHTLEKALKSSDGHSLIGPKGRVKGVGKISIQRLREHMKARAASVGGSGAGGRGGVV